MKMSGKSEWINVIFHISVPDSDNAAGRNFRDVVKAHAEVEQGGTISSQYPFIQSAELTQLQNGELYEYPERVRFDANLTIIQKRNIIDARYTALASSMGAKLEKWFEFYGSDRDVP